MLTGIKTSGPRGRIRAVHTDGQIEIHGVEICSGCQWLMRISAGKALLCPKCQPQMVEARALRDTLRTKEDSQ